MNPDNWFNGANNINKDHALTFGNGMNNNMGYWNAGSGSGMGVFSGYTPGFQNIVSPVLGDDGYPMLSDGSMVVKGGGTEYVTTSTGDGWMTQSLTSWPEVGGYNSNPPLYSTAKRYGNSDFPLASWATPGHSFFRMLVERIFLTGFKINGTMIARLAIFLIRVLRLRLPLVELRRMRM